MYAHGKAETFALGFTLRESELVSSAHAMFGFMLVLLFREQENNSTQKYQTAAMKYTMTHRTNIIADK